MDGVKYAEKILNVNSENLDVILDKYLEELKSPMVNLIVAGKTGVGKSTLINAVFGSELARTGIGEPITDELKLHTYPGAPIRIWDTIGFELGKTQHEDEIIDLVHEKFMSEDINETVDCMWYCINSFSHRIEPEEERFIKRFIDETNVPVIVVITHSVNEEAVELKSVIRKKNLGEKNIFCVLAKDLAYDINSVAKARNIRELTEFTCDLMPEQKQKTFAAVQQSSMSLKEKHAKQIIRATVATSFGVGFCPIPFSDAFVLIPTEIAMIVSIAKVYNVNISKSIISASLTAILGISGATILGKTIVSSVLKLIPVFGTATGGLISGATGAALTYAIGYTYMEIMKKLLTGELSQKDLENKSVMREYSKILKDNMSVFSSKKQINE